LVLTKVTQTIKKYNNLRILEIKKDTSQQVLYIQLLSLVTLVKFTFRVLQTQPLYLKKSTQETQF